MDAKTVKRVHTAPGGNNVLPFSSGKPSTPMPPNKFENSETDHRLRQKFHFFLQDLIRIASIANTNLPMNMLDDRGSIINIQNFLKRSGPKYIFQFIQTNTENLPIVRSGFSLIIVCLSYLKKLQMELKLDENSIGGTDSKYNYTPPPQAHHHPGMTVLQQKTAMNHFLEEKAWISQAISKINDSISVSSCMSIFVTTHDALTQELILNCVANLMFTSEDSVVQMLTPPSVFNKSNRALDEKEKMLLLNGAKRPHSRAATSETMVSKSSAHFFSGSSSNMNVEAAKASFRGENAGSRNRASSSFTEIPGIGNNNDGTGGNTTANSSSNNAEDRRNNGNGNNHPAKIEDGLMDPSQNSCLSYMFAGTVLQKNRHSLLAAAAEVIIVMTKDATQGLCEAIARVSTCPLPLLSAVNSMSSNGGGRRGRGGGGSGSSKKFGASSYDDESMLMPINPLTAGKTVEWAGVKVFLKFLHRYHSLMASKDLFIDLLSQQHQLLLFENPHEDKNVLTAMAMNNLTGLRASLMDHTISRIGSPLMGGTGGSLTSGGGGGAEEGELVTSAKLLSEDLQREFLMVHDRVFVALCFLIKGASNIATYILSLPGALDILRLSNIIFQERKQKNSQLIGAAFDMTSSQSSVSTNAPMQSISDEMEDAAVNVAMNTLQIEKQKNTRRQRGSVTPFNGNISSNSSILSLDHMIFAATGGSLPAGGNNLGQRLGLTVNLADTGSMSTNSGPVTDGQRQHSHHRGQSAPSPLARGFGNVKNAGNGSGSRKRIGTTSGKDNSGSVHGKKLQPLGAPVSLSPARLETLSSPITLAAADNHQRPANVLNFETPSYTVQTETKALYKQNQYNRQQVAAEPASDLQYLAVNRMVHNAQAPLQAPQSVDSLLNTSLQVIDREAKESVIHGQPQKDRLLQPALAANGRHPLLTDSVMNYNPSQSTFPMQSSSVLHQSSSGTFNHSNSNNQQSATSPTMFQPRPSTTSPMRTSSTGTNMGATKDFFGALPHKPIMPKRIEAQDAIMPQESMEIIRRKFQQIAAGAMNQIKSTGTVYHNGKNALSLQERARRVYSPKRAHTSSSSATGKSRSAADGPSSPLSRKESSGLQPLNFLDEEDDEEGDGQTMSTLTNKRGRQTHSTDSPTAATRGSEDDPEKTPAWNPRPEGLAYYGIRLDNVEFEEQDLFEHFKPIFGYEEHHDNAEAESKKKANADIYEQQQNPHGAFHATRGKIPGELEQTGDLLLL